MRRVWTPLAATVAGIGLAAGADDVEALFGFNPCPDPISYMKICCPKPCPVFDPAEAATRALQGARERAKLVEQTEQTSQVGELTALLGVPGKRAVTRESCAVGEALHAPVEGAEVMGATLKAQESDLRRRRAARLAAVAAADAEVAVRLIPAVIDSEAALGKRGADSAQNARDARDLIRALAEVRSARMNLDALAAHAESLAARTSSVEIAGDETLMGRRSTEQHGHDGWIRPEILPSWDPSGDDDAR